MMSYRQVLLSACQRSFLYLAVFLPVGIHAQVFPTDAVSGHEQLAEAVRDSSELFDPATGKLLPQVLVISDVDDVLLIPESVAGLSSVNEASTNGRNIPSPQDLSGRGGDVHYSSIAKTLAGATGLSFPDYRNLMVGLDSILKLERREEHPRRYSPQVFDPGIREFYSMVAPSQSMALTARSPRNPNDPAAAGLWQATVQDIDQKLRQDLKIDFNPAGADRSQSNLDERVSAAVDFVADRIELQARHLAGRNQDSLSEQEKLQLDALLLNKVVKVDSDGIVQVPTTVITGKDGSRKEVSAFRPKMARLVVEGGVGSAGSSPKGLSSLVLKKIYADANPDIEASDVTLLFVDNDGRHAEIVASTQVLSEAIFSQSANGTNDSSHRGATRSFRHDARIQDRERFLTQAGVIDGNYTDSKYMLRELLSLLLVEYPELRQGHDLVIARLLDHVLKKHPELLRGYEDVIEEIRQDSEDASRRSEGNHKAKSPMEDFLNNYDRQFLAEKETSTRLHQSAHGMDEIIPSAMRSDLLVLDLDDTVLRPSRTDASGQVLPSEGFDISGPWFGDMLAGAEEAGVPLGNWGELLSRYTGLASAQTPFEFVDQEGMQRLRQALLPMKKSSI